MKTWCGCAQWGRRRGAGALLSATTLMIGLSAVPAAVSAGTVSRPSSWRLLSPAAIPGVRSGAAMAFDAALGKVVLFGGGNSRTRLADTWIFDGSNWKRQSPPVSPPARTGASMVYDPAIGKVVLFGGSGPAGPLADTWLYDG